MILELILKLTSSFVFFFFFFLSYYYSHYILYIIELIAVVVVVVIIIIELIFEIKDNLLVEIYTYNFKTFNNLLYGFFLSIIYIFIYKIVVSPKQYATVRRNRPIPKHFVSMDKPKWGPKWYSYH